MSKCVKADDTFPSPLVAEMASCIVCCAGICAFNAAPLNLNVACLQLQHCLPLVQRYLLSKEQFLYPILVGQRGVVQQLEALECVECADLYVWFQLGDVRTERKVVLSTMNQGAVYLAADYFSS